MLGGDLLAAIFIRTLFIYLFLSISIKIMGKRQIGELEVEELVSTLVISEVAALPIADPDIPLMNAIIPVLFIVCIEIIISYVKNKSSLLKKYVEGEPIYLVYKGRLLQDVLKENRISVNELLCEMRIQGVSAIDELDYAVLEQNGSISLFKKDDTPLSHSVIIDGEIDLKMLSALGHDEIWLKKKLSKRGVTADGVFLMTVNDNDDIYIIRKESSK